MQAGLELLLCGIRDENCLVMVATWDKLSDVNLPRRKLVLAKVLIVYFFPCCRNIVQVCDKDYCIVCLGFNGQLFTRIRYICPCRTANCPNISSPANSCKGVRHLGFISLSVCCTFSLILSFCICCIAFFLL